MNTSLIAPPIFHLDLGVPEIHVTDDVVLSNKVNKGHFCMQITVNGHKDLGTYK